MRRFGHFAVHEDTEFLQQIMVAMTTLINNELLTDPAFKKHTEIDRQMLLMNENARSSVNGLVSTLQNMRVDLQACIMGTGGQEYTRAKLKMMSIVDDVMANIADNTTIIANTKKAISEFLGSRADKNTKELLRTNTVDVAKFRNKLADVTNQIKDAGLKEKLTSVMQALPGQNIRMHGLDKEGFELERRQGRKK